MSRRASSQRRRAHRYSPFATKLRRAEVPQIDHRVGDGVECVVPFADALETKQQSLELVFPAEDPLNGVESLLENGGINHWFGSALWRLSAARMGVDVGRHPAVENGFAIDSAIVGAIQTDEGSAQAKAGGFGNSFDLRQGFSKQGGTRCGCRELTRAAR